jgi:hypothetical protein
LLSNAIIKATFAVVANQKSGKALSKRLKLEALSKKFGTPTVRQAAALKLGQILGQQTNSNRTRYHATCCSSR